MEYAVIDLNTCNEKNIPIFNLQQLSTILHLKLPHDAVVFGCILLDFKNIDTGEVLPRTLISLDGKWADVSFRHLDTTPGVHTYVLTLLINQVCEDISYKFSYRVQDNRPCKPYVYMRHNKEAH